MSIETPTPDLNAPIPEPTDDEFRTAARYMYGCDEIDVDTTAVVSRGSDPGAYVAGWLWVTYSDVESLRQRNELEALQALRATNPPLSFSQAEALAAIQARIDGVWDHPALRKVGSAMRDQTEDIRHILSMVTPTS